MWLLTNIYDKEFQLPLVKKSNLYKFYSNDNLHRISIHENKEWFYEGRIFVRGSDNVFIEDLNKTKTNVLLDVCEENLIRKIKGNFTIVEICNNEFKLFSDPFGIFKYFYWKDSDHFIISNSLKEISKHIKLKPSMINMAIYALTYHFIGGKTAFTNLYHNKPGEFIKLDKQGLLTIESYWKPEQLLKIPHDQIQITDITSKITQTIKSTLNSKHISLSLTGGMDTRNLLAIFLSLGVSPHLYTYGDPLSNDCRKASLIAKKLKLNHVIHNININSTMFQDYAKRIIRISGGLASIHRAHRLMAIEKENDYANVMYLGTLGGEYVRGASEDDYIIPSIVYENWNNSFFSEKYFEKYLCKKRLTINDDYRSIIINKLLSEPFFNGTLLERKHNAISYITAHLHDAQDINLYRSVMDEVYTPFLDIDYLELLFSSQYSFVNKEKINNFILRKIENPLYGAQFLKATFPPLLNFRYSGEHIPKEILLNKYIAACLKKIRSMMNTRYPANFPLNSWMIDFVKKNLPICKEYGVIRTLFDIDKLMIDLYQKEHLSDEKYWLKFTNPTMMRFIIDEFGG